jgi:putative restriction endonuclease
VKNDSSKQLDSEIRLGAFNWLAEQEMSHGDVLPLDLLRHGFGFRGNTIKVIGPKGIFKPKILPEIPLSITTSPKSPYNDSFGKDNLLRYKYRGTDPRHHDNVGLRKAMISRTPLIYFHGVVPGKYLAVWPVFIVGDDSAALTFTVAADDMAFVKNKMFNTRDVDAVHEDTDTARRGYITSSVRVRLHQRGFRERVLNAYRSQCALCRLKHRELLDAAHIIPDHEKDGLPVVNNGMALCKLHHAAFDQSIIGIRPDYIVEVRKDIRDETDGPMLKHGLQGLHNQRIFLPKSIKLQPAQKLLERRWERFKACAP